MTATDRVTVEVQRTYTSEPEILFDAWFDQLNLGAWLFATPDGRMAKVEVEARAGGGFLIVEERGGEEVAHEGLYEIVDRPRRLSFFFSVKTFSTEQTRVLVDLHPLDAGTQLSLTHENVLAEYAERTKQGWTGILEKLAIVLGEAIQSPKGVASE